MIIIVCFLVLIFIIWFVKSDEYYPEIFLFGKNGPLITIIAGTHGDEQAPSLYFKDYIKQIVELPPGYRFAIVPVVNQDAFNADVRHTILQPDINRSWPDKDKINKYLLPLINKSDLVLDFHEAWKLSACQSNTLGQTLYTNTKKLYPLLDKTIKNINTKMDFNQTCMMWSRIVKLPEVIGSLDGYCDSINKPYILIEMTGHDKVPLETRFEQMQILLNELVGLQ
jgi:predicted deacylase